MKNIVLLLAFISIGQAAFANADTLSIRAHNATHLSWYGNYDEWAVFPSDTANFRKITMRYTLGCPSGGCSQWDYTTRVYARQKVQTPDTTYYEDIEIGRVITPYAGGFTSAWTREYKIDVSDYAPLLQDSVQIRVFYDGYSDGFTATLDFEFIEGIPARKPFKVINLWSGNFPYGAQGNSIENYLTPKTVIIDSQTVQARLRILQTGHGFGGNEDCAEFCPKNNYVKVNGNFEFTNLIWRDNCGENPLYPQPGTWLYDRANWCPGVDVHPYLHELTPFITPGQPLSLDLDMQPFNNINNNNTAYIIGSQLILYKAPNFTNDVALEAILSPSMLPEYSRFNPVCNSAQVVIRNNGTAPLTSAKILYSGDENEFTYQWSGNLAFDDTAIVNLPNVSYSPAPGSPFVFGATAFLPNGQPDEYADNNTQLSTYTLPEVLPNSFILLVKTNNRGYETSYKLVNESGATIISRRNLSNATLYRDTLNLPIGCYQLQLFDTGEDGLSFFADPNAGSGYMRLANLNGSLLKSYPADFGTSILNSFRVTQITGMPETAENLIQLYPNPATDWLTVFTPEQPDASGTVVLTDITGRIVATLALTAAKEQRIKVASLANGIYTLGIQTARGTTFNKVVIQH